MIWCEAARGSQTLAAEDRLLGRDGWGGGSGSRVWKEFPSAGTAGALGRVCALLLFAS